MTLEILGDFNFNCDERCEGYLLFKTFVDDYSIVCCDHISFNEIGYTYIQENSDHRSAIDHTFISDQLHNRQVKYCKMDSAINFSDHSPVMCTLALPNI